MAWIQRQHKDSVVLFTWLTECAEKTGMSIDIFIWCVCLLLQDACMLHSFTLRQQLQTARQGDSVLSLLSDQEWLVLMPIFLSTLCPSPPLSLPLPFFSSPYLLRVIPCSVPTRCCLPCDSQVDQGGYSCKRRWDILVQGGMARIVFHLASAREKKPCLSSIWWNHHLRGHMSHFWKVNSVMCFDAFQVLYHI